MRHRSVNALDVNWNDDGPSTRSDDGVESMRDLGSIGSRLLDFMSLLSTVVMLSEVLSHMSRESGGIILLIGMQAGKRSLERDLISAYPLRVLLSFST